MASRNRWVMLACSIIKYRNAIKTMSLFEGISVIQIFNKGKIIKLILFVTKPWVVVFRTSHPKHRFFLLRLITPWKRIQSWILDSSLGIPDSKYWIPIFCQWNLNSRFQSFVECRIPWAVFRILQAKIPGFWNSFTWCSTYRINPRKNFSKFAKGTWFQTYVLR